MISPTSAANKLSYRAKKFVCTLERFRSRVIFYQIYMIQKEVPHLNVVLFFKLAIEWIFWRTI